MKKGPFKMKGMQFKQDQAPMKKVSPMKLDPITTTILSSVAGKLVGKLFGGGNKKSAEEAQRAEQAGEGMRKFASINFGKGSAATMRRSPMKEDGGGLLAGIKNWWGSLDEDTKKNLTSKAVKVGTGIVEKMSSKKEKEQPVTPNYMSGFEKMDFTGSNRIKT
tara:strand:+ start:493 stop:981 length:489 start_codon:yes stop_codon:yes gene_type:complete